MARQARVFRAGRDTLGVNATRSTTVTNRSHRDVKIFPFVDLGPVAKPSENESQCFGRRRKTAVELGRQAMDCPSPKRPETFPPVTGAGRTRDDIRGFKRDNSMVDDRAWIVECLR